MSALWAGWQGVHQKTGVPLWTNSKDQHGRPSDSLQTLMKGSQRYHWLVLYENWIFSEEWNALRERESKMSVSPAEMVSPGLWRQEKQERSKGRKQHESLINRDLRQAEKNWECCFFIKLIYHWTSEADTVVAGGSSGDRMFLGMHHFLDLKGFCEPLHKRLRQMQSTKW